jgi:hypothetical protein
MRVSPKNTFSTVLAGVLPYAADGKKRKWRRIPSAKLLTLEVMDHAKKLCSDLPRQYVRILELSVKPGQNRPALRAAESITKLVQAFVETWCILPKRPVAGVLH